MRIQSIFLFIIGLIFTAEALAADPGVVRLATTTSAKSSGVLDVLVPAFEKASGYRIELTIVATGRALRLGRFGRVDVVLVHAPAAERRFVQNGWGVQRRPVMKNHFVLVGPASDPAGIRGMRNSGDALREIAGSRSTFVSRGDDSGTHKKELQGWGKAGIAPAGDWYYESGTSMGDTLRLASEQQFYTLVDSGTWLALHGGLSLELFVEGDPDLDNLYSIIEINPERHPHVNYQGAMAFSDWLQSSAGQQLILGFEIDGEQLYFPLTESGN